LATSSARAINCYSIGILETSAGGIYGTLKNASATATNCYFTNGINNWNDNNAKSNLIGYSELYVGSIWTNPDGLETTSSPWILSGFGLSLYIPDFSTIIAGLSTNSASITENSNYSIITISSSSTFSNNLSNTNISINNSNGIMSTTHITPYNTYSLHILNNITNYTNASQTLTAYMVDNYTLSVTSPPCFNEGTCILIVDNNIEQYIPIEQLKPGDHVKTYIHGYKKIKIIGKNKMMNDPSIFSQCMYKMDKNNDMIDDLLVTGWHSILVDDMTTDEENRQYFHKYEIDGKKLLLSSISDKFNKINEIKEFTYYNIVLDDNDDNKQYGIWANGILTESMSERVFYSKPWNCKRT
jgi:hypothetical protein